MLETSSNIRPNDYNHQPFFIPQTGNTFIGGNPLPVIQETEKEQEKMQPSTDDFIAKTQDEVIRVPKCTYANDSKKNTRYFLCNCSSSKGFEPICEACASFCHKSHHPTLEVPGVNTCSCGLNNHLVTQEMENTAKEKSENAQTQAQCFYSKFFDITPNRGYYRFEGTTYCAVCVENCLMMKFDDMALTQLEEGRHVCCCPQFHEVNVIKLNADFISRKTFHKHMRNFNFNILFKIPKSKQIYIDALTAQISMYVSKKSVETNSEFFNNFIVVKILELFSTFAVYWENKFFHVVPTLLGIFKMKDLFDLLSLNDMINTIKEEFATNFISGKFFFAELLFNYIVRTFMLKFNNLWNFRTIINMNLFQRLIYIHNIKHFNLLLKEEYTENEIDDLIGNILNLYDSIILINERADVIERIMSYVFPTFNRIMKYMIKYNLLNEENKKRYFDLVFETLHIQNEKQKGNLKDSVFYIMKSVIYTTIYSNDLVCFDYINGTKNKKGFMFTIKEESVKLCKIFLYIIKDFDRKEDLNRTIIFDYYVRKYFEMMMHKEDFYINTIRNLTEEEIGIIKRFTNTNAPNYFISVKNSFDHDFFDAVSNFTIDLNTYNRQYFSYEIPHDIYCKNIYDIIKTFRDFILSHHINVEEIKIKYCSFMPVPIQQSEQTVLSNENLSKLKKVVFYSNFFQKVEEVIHIYAQGKIFPSSSESFEYDKEGLLENFAFLLKLLYTLCNKDWAMLCLVMNIKPKIFVATFYDIPDVLLMFLERISEMLFSRIQNDKISLNTLIRSDDDIEDSSYKFDNYYFLSECLCELLIINNESGNNMNLNILTKIIKVATKCIQNINMNNLDFLNVVEQFNIVFKKLSDNSKVVDRIEKFFNDSFIDKKEKDNNEQQQQYSNKQSYKYGYASQKKEETDNEIISFIEEYYSFLGELIKNDIEFYDYIPNKNIISRELFEGFYLRCLDNKFKNIPPKMQYALSYYFFQLKHPFIVKISTIQEQMKNLFMEEIPQIERISLPHLSKRLFRDVGIDKKKQLFDTIQLLLNLYKQFSMETFINEDNIFILKYYENIIVRPLFVYLNYSILYIKQITDKDLPLFKQLMQYFLKITLDVYRNEKFLNQAIDENKLKLIYEEIVVKSELTKSIIDDISDDYNELNQSYNRAFDMEELHGFLIDNIERITERSFSGQLGTLAQTKVSRLSQQINVPITEAHLNLQKKKKLVNKYIKYKEITYDENLCMIHSLNTLTAEMEEKDFSLDLINYLQTKLFDKLTDLNIRKFNPKDLEYSSNELLNVTEYKVQNLWVLIYLNQLFYHDSLDFQLAFTSDEANVPENYFNFIIEHVIVSSTLNEVIKLFSLDSLTQTNDNSRVMGTKETLSFQMGKYAIKFIQNLCEGHNKYFQSLFFGLLLDKNEYLESNNNIYSNKHINIIGDNSSKDDQQKKDSGKQNQIQEPFFNLKQIIANVAKEKSVSESNVNEDEEASEESKKESEENDDELYSDKTNQDIDDLGEEDRLYYNQVSFFNLICYMMRIINNNLHVNNSQESKILKSLIDIKSYDNIIELYTRYSDLVIEMIQGTDSSNFKHFYGKNLPQSYQMFMEDGTFIQNPEFNSFNFLCLAMQIKQILFDQELLFNSLAFNMKYSLFMTMNNVLSQKKIDRAIVEAFTTLFQPEKLIDIISKYLRGIYIKFILKINYDNDSFMESFNYLQLNQAKLTEIITAFKTNPHIYEDEAFKLASQMFLFITTLGKKYSVGEAQKVLKYSEKSFYYQKEDNKTNPTAFWLVNQVNHAHSHVKLSDHNYMMDYIASSKFFNKIIKQCEFKVDAGDGDLELKVIYFIVDPHVYYISKSNIENFFNNVDRSSGTTKLKALIDVLNLFMSEVEYKSSVFKKSQYIISLLAIEYKNVDFYNFIISLLINFIMLLFLTGDEKQERILRYLTMICVGTQSLMNIIFLVIFLFSKYKFYVLLRKNELGKKKKLTIREMLNVYVFDSFLFNDEIYLLLLIIVLGGMGIFSKYGSFFFALQLLTVIKFIDTIKEIFLAFKLRFIQLICIIGFLLILIFFYANVGFYFLIDEFDAVIDNQPKNYCQTLIECTVTYFNHGVRSGGGIGDVVGSEKFDDMSIYLARWTHDLFFYITVILLLLNMINGVIVSTFGKIREDSNQKEEDINNKCFICNIDRIEFEKKKVDFKDHQKYEHNLKHYIKFLIGVKRIDEKDLDSDQSFVVSCLKNRDIKCFPVKCAVSVGNIEDEEEEESEGGNDNETQMS